MSRDEKIDELSKGIFEHCNAGLFEDEAEQIARFVIEGQGYRKASDVAREIFAQVDGITDLLAVGDIGELEMYDLLAELKKKYTEE